MLVTDQMVQDAFDWLHENAEPAAAARAAKIRAEYNVKKTKAMIFRECHGTVAERENAAIADIRYMQAVSREADAVESDEIFRNQKDKCFAIIEAWRTEQANLRGMGKVG